MRTSTTITIADRICHWNETRRRHVKWNHRQEVTSSPFRKSVACTIATRGPLDAAPTATNETMLRLFLTNLWLRLQCAYLNWRLRRRGIAPDSIPENEQSHRQRAEQSDNSSQVADMIDMNRHH